MYNILQYPYNPEPSVVRREMLDFANKPSIMTTIIRGFLTVFLLLLIPSCAEADEDCNKRDKEQFPPCLNEKFPIGSSYADLDRYLKQQEFKKANSPEDYQNNRFYYFWSPNNLNLANYRIIVTGQYSNDLKIVELESH